VSAHAELHEIGAELRCRARAGFRRSGYPGGHRRCAHGGRVSLRRAAHDTLHRVEHRAHFGENCKPRCVVHADRNPVVLQRNITARSADGWLRRPRVVVVRPRASCTERRGNE
jgi:hypothetical protein